MLLNQPQFLGDCCIYIGRHFASPIKPGARAERANKRSTDKFIRDHSSTPAPHSSKSVTPAMISEEPGSSSTNEEDQVTSQIDVHTALLARIELLESENKSLKVAPNKKHHFCIEDIQHDDKMVLFYTGFVSFRVFSAFFDFLGPAVNHLNYWGSKTRTDLQRRRSFKLDPKNQLFLTLVKLKLNLKLKDLAYRFGISPSQTSRYITTWICFLYHQLKEINWMPTVNQVLGTLPAAFQENYPTTYALIDGSEVFIETPSDLSIQSSTWSQYKHHNTVKFLVACTPNGAIC